jgi:hypothetical protein
MVWDGLSSFYATSIDISRWCPEEMGRLYWRTSRADVSQQMQRRMIANHIATTTRPPVRLVRLARHCLLPRLNMSRGDVDEKADEPLVAMLTLG